MRRLREYQVSVRMEDDSTVWHYQTMAKSHGHAVERILVNTGWVPAALADFFIVSVQEFKP